jgi:hypothetical protein
VKELGRVIAVGVGDTSVLAKLILLQSAQKSWVRPDGAFCRGEAGPAAALLGTPAEITDLSARPMPAR